MEEKEEVTLAEEDILGAYLIVGSPTFCSLDDSERLFVEAYIKRNPTWPAECDFPVGFTLSTEVVPSAKVIERLVMPVLNSDFARRFGRYSLFFQPFVVSSVEEKDVQVCLLTFAKCPPTEKNKIFIVQGEIKFKK